MKTSRMKTKIQKQFAIISAIAVFVTAISSMLLYYKIFISQIYEDMSAYAHIISQMNMEQMINSISYNPGNDNLRITVIGDTGDVIYDNMAAQEDMDNHMDRPEIVAAYETGEGTSIRWSETRGSHTFYYAVELEDGNLLRIGKESQNIYNIFKNTLLLIVILSIFVLSLCVLFSHFLTKRLLRPIERMTTNPDGLSQEFIYQEIRPFISTIKEQHINILNSAKIRQEFTANISHELKTPLTAISGYAELIESGMANEKDTKRFAHEIHHSSDRLLTLINDIIKLSELDDTELKPDFEQFDLFQSAQACIDMIEIWADKQEVFISLEGESCIITANKNLIDELIYNLCSNAIRYNYRGGSVKIRVEKQNGKVTLAVKDTGIGIPLKHQERIFERFYRVDKSRSKQNGGTGLGLAIVKHIVAQHNAEIKLSSEPQKGTEIKVIFS